MYNPYQAPPGAYPPPSGYGSFPGAPGMAPPPGMAAAPGTAAPPGMQQADTPTDGRPSGFPPNFQPPANMPNINFSAPVIRLGTSQPARSSLLDGRDDRGGGGGGRRAGLGSGVDGGRQDRAGGGLAPVQPQTREEIIKTVFIGGITEGCGGDEGIERILRAVGNLKRWVRATDALDKPCKFGFAEYEDPESLNTAIEVLKNVRVPVKRQVPKEEKNKVKSENGGEDGEEEEEVQKSLLLVVADENSHTYLEQYEESIGGVDADSRQVRLDHARAALEAVLNDLAYPMVAQPKDEMSGLDRDGDIEMANGVDANGEAIITIPISADDELSDIPAEMREMVAKEIASFRDRSNRRDMERLRREEEIEAQERNRMINGSGRPSRLGSPPLSAPSGPGSNTNGIPSGPRDRASGLNAPSGPKSLTTSGGGVQIPRDYAKGVTFVNGTGISTGANFDESDTDASDGELDRRRKAAKRADEEKAYLDQERRWLNRERSRTAAVEREKARDDEEASKLEDERQAMGTRLKEFDDDKEAARAADEYYADHSAWMRKRSAFRERERMHDEADRAAERREREWEQRQRGGRDAGDSYGDRDRERGGDDYDRSRDRDRRREDDDRRRQSSSQHQQQPPSATTPTAPQPARFKLSLGAAAQRQASEREKNKRTVAEVEGLLEDEESTSPQKRELVKIDLGPVAPPTGPSGAGGADMTPEQRAAAAKQLAGEIPNDVEGLWAWDVKWEFVDEESVIEERLRPFVEKKIVEYLGVQEQMLVDVVVEGLKVRKGARELVGELEGALDEEAEQLVKKLWRMVIFFSESEKRGLSA